MSQKTLIILVVGAAVLYFVMKPAAQPKPTGAGAILGDLGKLVGDFGGQSA
jgi:hypothetical protein